MSQVKSLSTARHLAYDPPFSAIPPKSKHRQQPTTRFPAILKVESDALEFGSMVNLSGSNFMISNSNVESPAPQRPFGLFC